MIRPHRIRLSDEILAPDGATNRIRAQVRKIIFAGDVVQCEITADGISLLVESPTASTGASPSVGDEVTASWQAADTLVFPSR
jgi:ABC-type Fe3+/spermidine/putrescine transport system ATPase subunit